MLLPWMARLILHGGADATPSLAVPAAYRLPGTGVISGIGGYPPSAPVGGWAQWYGPGLYGRATASDEPCARHERTSTSRTSPLDTTAREALQVGCTTVHAPGLVSTVLVCKRAD